MPTQRWPQGPRAPSNYRYPSARTSAPSNYRYPSAIHLPWHTPKYLGSDPPRETYRYLGVELNVALDWKADAADSAARAETKASCIQDSAASLRQKLMLHGDNVVTSAAYRLAAGGTTPSAAARLDADIARYAKRMWGASRSTAGTFVFLPPDLHGRGVPSIRQELVKTYGRVPS